MSNHIGMNNLTVATQDAIIEFFRLHPKYEMSVFNDIVQLAHTIEFHAYLKGAEDVSTVDELLVNHLKRESL